MTEGSSGIQGAGKGYFSSEGVLKSKSEVANEDKITETKRTEEAAVIDESFGKKTDTAFQKVEGRFLEKANQALTIASETESKLREVKQVINKEIKAAKELKEAIKNNNADDEEVARKKLIEAQEQRRVVEEEVEKFNLEKTPERRVSLNVGNSEKSKVEIKEIKLSKSETNQSSDLDRAKQVQAYIDSLKEERSSINQQLKDVKETKEEVGDTVSRVRAELTSLEKNAIASYDEAAKTADKIANSIRQGGQELVQSTISSKITPEILAKFLG